MLRELKAAFAWPYTEIPGLNPELVVHHLSVRTDAKLAKQAPRLTHPNVARKIRDSIKGLQKARFIEPVAYQLVNIVPIKK